MTAWVTESEYLRMLARACRRDPEHRPEAIFANDPELIDRLLARKRFLNRWERDFLTSIRSWRRITLLQHTKLMAIARRVKR